MHTDDKLLKLYMEELRYVRELGMEFAERHPRVGARLRLGPQESPDPQTERLIESLAFLTSYLRRDLDLESRHLYELLLENLYPFYVRPVPSCAIAQLQPLPKPERLERGRFCYFDAVVSQSSTATGNIRFATTAPVTVWPLKPGEPRVRTTRFTGESGVSRLTVPITTSHATIKLKQLTDMNVLRFYLGLAQETSLELHEYLLRYVTRVWVRPLDLSSNQTPQVLELSGDMLAPVGFQNNESLLLDELDDELPQAYNNVHPYSFLWEFFNFREKFLFVDLHFRRGASPHPFEDDKWAQANGFELEFEFDRQLPGLDKINRDSLVLNCVPVINLFRQTTEPVRIDQTQSRYTLVPDRQRSSTTEIYAVRSVSSTVDPKMAYRRIEPYFRHHHLDDAKPPIYWIARRKQALDATLGSQIDLSFVDPHMNPALPEERVMFAHTLCTNRGVARQLAARTRFIIDGSKVEGMLLMPPTAQRDAPNSLSYLRALVSQLTINKQPLRNDGQGLETLRTLLRLHVGPQRTAALQQINEGLAGMTMRRATAYLCDPEVSWRGFVRGLAVALTFKRRHFAETSPFLMALIIRRFLERYASINSFVQVRYIAEQDTLTEELLWPPTWGVKPAL